MSEFRSWFDTVLWSPTAAQKEDILRAIVELGYDNVALLTSLVSSSGLPDSELSKMNITNWLAGGVSSCSLSAARAARLRGYTLARR